MMNNSLKKFIICPIKVTLFSLCINHPSDNLDKKANCFFEKHFYQAALFLKKIIRVATITQSTSSLETNLILGAKHFLL